MCGSGTIAIEAGLLAFNIPPGKVRPFFGFSRWKDFDKELFDRVKREADSKITGNRVSISASDISEQAVEQAVENISIAGLSGKINVELLDFTAAVPKEPGGFLVFNPPYGQRLQPDAIENLYKMIGSVMKHNFPGYRAWIITAGRELLKNIGLKPKSKFTLYNGAIECVLAGYELYEGSRKQRAG
jgi:putative N6-adenine-specific DNA methylase